MKVDDTRSLHAVVLISYVGHGAIDLWADENIFNTANIATLAPQSEQPFVLTLNCLNGYFHFPYFDSLAEPLVKAEDKGAIAAISPSGLSLNEPAHPARGPASRAPRRRSRASGRCSPRRPRRLRLDRQLP